MKNLTVRQNQVLNYIAGYLRTHNYPPTIREISEFLGISVKGAYDHVKALQKKGRLRFNNNRSRTIELVGQDMEEESDDRSSVVEIPILGNVAAGVPLLSEENFDGWVSLPLTMLSNGRYFALTVSGDSMIDAGIHSGDTCVFVQQHAADNGEIVVAMVDEAVTLKRFYKEKNRIRLQADNQAYPPIYSQDVRVLGKLVHLLRSYH